MVDSAGKTLVEIASLSRRVFHKLIKYAGGKTTESFQLEKIVVASGTILETLNGTLFLETATVDDRLKDWLSSNEPKMCLGILNRMDALLSPQADHTYSIKNLFLSSSSPSSKDKSNEAIRIFLKHEAYFHFLLSTEIWNRESASGAQQQHSMPRECDSLAPEAVKGKVGDTPSVISTQNMRKRGIDIKKLNTTLRWLHAWSCSEIYERTLLLRQPDTCIWLHNMNAYKMWKTTGDSFTWLHGKPGAGKSVLATSVIESLKSSSQDGEILAYFYCDFRTERSTRAAEVMRSLLSQLLQQFHHHAVDPGNLIDKLVGERDSGTSTIRNVMLLARYVSQAAKCFNRQPFLIVDALDECADIEDLLDALKELRRGGIRLFVTSRPLQIIKDSFLGLSSIDIYATKYEISADIKLHVTRELESHRRLRIIDVSLKDEMYSVLCKRADGIFRWVQCQLSTLKRCITAVQVRDALINLPSSLSETYERVLLRMTDEERKVALRTLTWLVVTLQPLQLSQIMEGLSIDIIQRVVNRDAGPLHGTALLDVLGSLVTYNEVTDIVMLSHFSVKEYLVSARNTHPSYHINERAAHKQLFLLCMCYIGIYLEQNGHWQSRYHGVSSHNKGAIIGLDDPLSPSSSPTVHTLDEYVIHFGLHHLSHINPNDTAVLSAIQALHSNAQQYPSEWERFCRRSRSLLYPYPSSKHDFMLYILIAFAPTQLLRTFIGHAQLKWKKGTNPLLYAAYFGKVKHARILLSSGVHLHLKGWHGYLDRQLLPIEAAAKQGDLSMVDLFLAEGSPIPRELFASALMSHCPFPARIVSRLLQTDEFVEWVTANGQDEALLLRALDPSRYFSFHTHRMSQQDIDLIQRRLVQVGCDPSARFNETHIRRAVSAGHISDVQHMLSLGMQLPPDVILYASFGTSNAAMMRLCLSTGSDIGVVSVSEDTPLHVAISWLSPDPDPMELEDCLESIQVLVNAGCNPSSCNLAGKTPLHLAIRQGYLPVAEYLLALHSPLPSDILLTISMSCKASMIYLLTRNGANVHAIAENGDTPLHRVLDDRGADMEEQLNCIKALISAGCDPFQRNADGKTPFDIAVENGSLLVVQHLDDVLGLPLPSDILCSVVGSTSLDRTPVIKFLIDVGASIRVTQPSGDTLLHLAILSPVRSSETECLKRVKFLVGAGCDPRARNMAGETPFHLAAKQGLLQVMEYFLSLNISVPSDIMITQFEGDSSSLPGRRCQHSVYYLLEKGGAVHTIAENGDTLLHLAARLDPEEESLQLVLYLVGAGCIPCARNLNQETPLHIAARSGFISVIQYFLSLNIPLPPDILLAATSKYSAGKAPFLRWLVEQGSSVSFSTGTSEGDTPLHLLLAQAGGEDLQECVKILIDSGCDPHAQNFAGETPLHVAARRGHSGILEYFVSQGVSLPQDILLASETLATLQFAIGKGYDFHGVTASSLANLMHRVFNHGKRGLVEFSKILVGVGWDPLQKSSTGETAIHTAARNGHIAVIKFFLSQHIPFPPDVLLASVPSVSLISWQAYDAVSLVRLFIREGARVNVATGNGDTPLHLALIHGFTSSMDTFRQRRSWHLVEILLNAGSDPHTRNGDGQTPLNLAEAKGHLFKENFLRLVRSVDAERSGAGGESISWIPDRKSACVTDLGTREIGRKRLFD